MPNRRGRALSNAGSPLSVAGPSLDTDESYRSVVTVSNYSASTRWTLILHRSCEPLDELERRLGDLPPPGVDRQRVPAARHLDHLGHALVALLLLVCRVRYRKRDRLIPIGRDDQHRTPFRVRRVDLRF